MLDFDIVLMKRVKEQQPLIDKEEEKKQQQQKDEKESNNYLQAPFSFPLIPSHILYHPSLSDPSSLHLSIYQNYLQPATHTRAPTIYIIFKFYSPFVCVTPSRSLAYLHCF